MEAVNSGLTDVMVSLLQLGATGSPELSAIIGLTDNGDVSNSHNIINLRNTCK